LEFVGKDARIEHQPLADEEPRSGVPAQNDAWAKLASPLKVAPFKSAVAAEAPSTGRETTGVVLERFQERVEPLGADRRSASVKPIAVVSPYDRGVELVGGRVLKTNHSQARSTVLKKHHVSSNI
jgi:hypothetical protein